MTTSFKIECEIPERWAPHFLGLLKAMEKCGNIGRSSYLVFFSDGDGDFYPKFKIIGADEITPTDGHDAKKVCRHLMFSEGDRFFDAG